MKDILDRADDFEDKVADTDIEVGKSIEILMVANKQNRNSIKWLKVFGLINALLVIAVGYTALNTNRNSIRIEQQQNILVNNCIVGNEFRAENKSFWDYIITLTPSDEPSTPEQQQRIEAFQTKLNDTFAQRDCSEIEDIGE